MIAKKVGCLFFLFNAICFTISSSAFCQDKQFAYITTTGDVKQGQSESPARIHFQGSIAVASADYFRGSFDGVQEDLDDWSFQQAFRMIFEIGEESSFTAGLANSLSDADPFTVDNLDIWYEANPHFGLATKFSNLLAGLTFTVYGSPNDALSSSEEFALELKGTGDHTVFGILASWIKVAYNIDNGGYFFGLGIDPNIKFLEKKGFRMKLSVPIELGTGVDQYFTDDDWEGYISTGLKGSMPMSRFIPESYGQWKLEPSLNVTFRDDSLIGDEYDDAGDVIVYGSIALSVIY